jgi:hypothetical protein
MWFVGTQKFTYEELDPQWGGIEVAGPLEVGPRQKQLGHGAPPERSNAGFVEWISSLESGFL